VILEDNELNIKNKVELAGLPLADWKIKINRGILTGCNEAFIITGTQRREIINGCKSEEEKTRTYELIRPILRGRDIKRYSYVFSDQYIIATFPARHYNINDYPAVKEYFCAFGSERLEQTGKIYDINGVKIKSRKKTNNQWFETQDSINYWEDFNKQKIIWGEISDKTNFCLDIKGDYVCEATTFLMTGHSLIYLLCYLNSPLSEFLFSKIGTTTGVGTTRWKKFKIEQLYVPIISASQEQYINELYYKFLNEKDSSIIRTINNYIYSIAKLTMEEISFIESLTHSKSAFNRLTRY
jgi:hypothetical protein